MERDILEQAVEKLVRRAFSELSGNHHLPRLARVVSVCEPINQPETCDTFRSYYAADIELLTPEFVRDETTPIYEQVPLPVPAGGTEEQGLFAFPAKGTIVEIAFAFGLPHRPFIRTILPFFSSLPELKPNEQTWQQSQAVRQRANENGDWIRETFATIYDKSTTRKIESGSNDENYSNDFKGVSGNSVEQIEGLKRIVALGALRLLTGGTAHIGAGDTLSLSSGLDLQSFIGRNLKESIGNNKQSKIENNLSIETGNNLTEQVGNVKESIAELKQIIKVAEGGTVWVGSESVNVLQILSQLIDVVANLAGTCATHVHPSVSTSPQASSFTAQQTSANSLKSSLDPVVE